MAISDVKGMMQWRLAAVSCGFFAYISDMLEKLTQRGGWMMISGKTRETMELHGAEIRRRI